MLKIVLLLLGLFLASASATSEADWAVFKDKYQRMYSDEIEDLRRRDIYAANIKKIKEHNELYAQGLSSYYMGENQFSDWTEEEFSGRTKKSNVKIGSRKTHRAKIDVSKLPKSVDWRKKGFVTPVKNQGNCESSYAFAAIAALEGQHFKYKEELLELSESQVLDCSNVDPYWNEGCSIGFVDDSYQYICGVGGVELASTYPYVARVRNCTYKKDKVAATVSGYIVVEQSELAVQNATAIAGPITAFIDSPLSLRDYSGGVYDDPKCSQYQADHQVTIVGYGTDKGKDYWLVKNSWGKGWGEDGYIRMARNKNNQCGISNRNRYPIV